MDMICDFEKSQQRGKRVNDKKQPLKIILGNKEDLLVKQKLDAAELRKLKTKGINISEVSALTNHGVQEAFNKLVVDMQNTFNEHKQHLKKDEDKDDKRIKDSKKNKRHNQQKKDQQSSYNFSKLFAPRQP
jgi:50S ribosomal subunit-associated GTPase HflX